MIRANRFEAPDPFDSRRNPGAASRDDACEAETDESPAGHRDESASAEATEALWADLREAAHACQKSFATTVAIARERFALGLDTLMTRVVLGIGIAIVAVALIWFGVATLVTGLASGFTALFGSVWAGQLAAAALILGGFATAWAIWSSRRAKRAYERALEIREEAASAEEGTPARGTSARQPNSACRSAATRYPLTSAP